MKEKHMQMCYLRQTENMRRVFDNDFYKVAQACREAPEIAQRHCYISYGRDAGAEEVCPKITESQQ